MKKNNSSYKNIISDLLLEKYIHNELDAEEKLLLKNYFKNNKNAQRRVDKLRDSDKKIINDYPVEKIIGGVEYRCQEENERKKRKLLKILAPAVGLAAFTLIIINPGFIKTFIPDKITLENTIRFKGGTKLYIYIKKGNQVIQLENYSTVRTGDVIQVAYLAGADNYGVIFSLDGDRNISLHYPYNINNSAKLEKDKKQYLTVSCELDTAPKYEQFYFITSKNKINVKTVMKKADQLRNNPDQAEKNINEIYRDYNIYKLVLVKEK